jgi:hydroxysqualene dehydroxylase
MCSLAGPVGLSPTVHVVGAGLAGLSAALRLSEHSGFGVVVHEATGRAGGRCWSFHDERLGRWIDNGNHLILSGNRNVLDYVSGTGARDRLKILPAAAFPFRDLARDKSWSVRISRSPLPFLTGYGIPGAGPGMAFDFLRILTSSQSRTVADAIAGRGPIWRTFWRPLAVSILNAPPEEASAALLAGVFRQSLLGGAQACRPVLAPGGLWSALVEPALERLQRRGVEVRFREPLVGIETDGDRAVGLRFSSGSRSVGLSQDDCLILAAPPGKLGDILGVQMPAPGYTIANAHFVVPELVAQSIPEVCGIVGGTADWLFRRGDVVSVTVSCAECTPLSSMNTSEAISHLWKDVAQVSGRPNAEPIAARFLQERAATWNPSPASSARRPQARSRLQNVLLAGDHVHSDLPATLEAAVRSGFTAANALTNALGAADRAKRDDATATSRPGR